jgi:hypothetical protein
MQDCNALQAAVAKPTDKQHLPPSACASTGSSGGGLTVNPAHAVRRPKYVVKRGKILTADQARLLDGIDTSTLVGLRDRALIGVMQLGESSGQCRLIFAVVRRSRGGGCGQSRRRYARQVLGNDSRIERRDGAVRQSGPDFVHSEKRYPEVTADREPLAIRADRHLGMVYVAIARIENVAILVLQSAAPHVPDERDAKDRRILAIVHAFGADRIGFVLGPRKTLGDGALIDAIVIHEQKPSYWLAGFVYLLPQTSGGRLRPLLRVQRRGA